MPRHAASWALVALLLFLLRPPHPGSARRGVRVRPSPSEHLPVPDLREEPDPELDPRVQDLSEPALRRKLGRAFDADFMSAGPPPSSSPSPPATPPPPAPAELRRLDLDLDLPGVGGRARRRLLRLLWGHTHCPVAYAWRDLGVRFWPRFVKDGRCLTQRSCSLPAGMSCRPAAAVTKTLLRWHCQGFLQPRFCSWIPVHYPIISQCKCSC